MEIPPLLPNVPALSAGEKRITVRLKKYWNFLREERSFPAESEIKPEFISDIWSNCFIVKADNSCKREDYKYKYLGANIIKAYGKDLTGLDVNKMVAPEASHLAEQYERVLAVKIPVIDEGEINISKNEIIKYRQILLPLGDDGININAILGGMSYKVARSDKQSFFMRLGSKK